MNKKFHDCFLYQQKVRTIWGLLFLYESTYFGLLHCSHNKKILFLYDEYELYIYI